MLFRDFSLFHQEHYVLDVSLLFFGLFFFLLPDLKATTTLWKLPISHHGLYLHKRNVRTGGPLTNECSVDLPSLTKGHIPYRAYVYGQLQNACCGTWDEESWLCIHAAHGSAPLPLVNLNHMHPCICRTFSHRLRMLPVGAWPCHRPATISVSTPASGEPAPCQGRTEKGSSMN